MVTTKLATSGPCFNDEKDDWGYSFLTSAIRFWRSLDNLDGAISVEI